MEEVEEDGQIALLGVMPHGEAPANPTRNPRNRRGGRGGRGRGRAGQRNGKFSVR